MKLSAFPCYGGKVMYAPWIISHFPEHHHYVEPFCGAASVLFAKEPSPIETINDVDGNIVNFFKQLRDHPDELIRAVDLTPHSREEYVAAVKARDSETPIADDLERARMFFILAMTARMGIFQTCKNGSWKYDVTHVRSSAWSGNLPRLEVISLRLKRVQVENLDALDIIKRYDSSGTLFYVDPPYVHESRGPSKRMPYLGEMTNGDHSELASTLNTVSAAVVVSGYQCDFAESAYKGWRRVDNPKELVSPASNFVVRGVAGSAHGSSAGVSSKRTTLESLWMNF